MINVYFLKAGENLRSPSALTERFVQVIENLGFRVLIDSIKKKANLDKADVFVVEVSEITPRIGYVIAYALTRRKPVLCLYQSELINKKELAYLSQGVSVKLIKIQPYKKETLHLDLEGYLRQKQNREISTTKFTLRVPASFVEYLDWKKNKTGRSKASIIRDDFMDKVVRKERDFQQFLSQKK